MTATGFEPSSGDEARAWAIRSVSSSRFGSPVIGSWRAPRRASSNRRELSRAIEASWANRARACVSRGPNVRSGVPDARPMTPTVAPPDASGTPRADPKVDRGTSVDRPTNVS